MDQLTKSAHFLVVQMAFTFEEFDRLYIREIVQLYVMSGSIGSGSLVHDSVLEEFPEGHGDTDENEHSVSSVDRRTVKVDYPGFGGHVVSMRPGLQEWLG